MPIHKMNPNCGNDLMILAKSLREAADDLQAHIALGTKEQWSAWEELCSAARYLHSAGAQLDIAAQREAPVKVLLSDEAWLAYLAANRNGSDAKDCDICKAIAANPRHEDGHSEDYERLAAKFNDLGHERETMQQSMHHAMADRDNLRNDFEAYKTMAVRKAQELYEQYETLADAHRAQAAELERSYSEIASLRGAHFDNKGD